LEWNYVFLNSSVSTKLKKKLKQIEYTNHVLYSELLYEKHI